MNQRRTTRACDPCKRRKVRCNGQSRCQQCTHLGLRCLYTSSATSTARKRKLMRGSVINECRTLEYLQNGATKSTETLASRVVAMSIPASIVSHPNPSFFHEFLYEYERYVFPMSPVIPAKEVEEMISRMDESRDAASFVYIFAAVTLNLTRGEPVQEAPATRERIATLLSRSLEYRRPFAFDAQPTVVSVMTSIFSEMCSVGLRRLDMGFFYLREAISLLYMLHAHSDEALLEFSLPLRARLQRAYWECFIHERFTALTYNRPPCLKALRGLPDHDPTLPEEVEVGFNHNINNFCLVDREFLQHWLGEKSGVSSEWIEHKQLQLEDNTWHHEVSKLPGMMQADLIITRHWLRTLTWQIALSNTLLSSSPDSSLLLSLSFPLRLSNQLRQFLVGIPRDMVGIHGSGILEKLFEIANVITDVVLHLPHARGDETIQRIHDIVFLKNFVYSFAGFQTLRPAMLTQKFELIREKYPEIREIELLL
ncbi:hypothetical protein PDE_04152 [Penicillium oxalicum 114-2]|uniref:Zn(2)-C6 fungal-type domain-containing protein n=1 Tax=Penicillium oxalicum (strain 114-2 / CGMCC 5302) TaxID=933388 RepID=S8ASX9_PENO1|nr:hypothetical protein PDE_04152 [Penicillium oxalicum 114-2]